MNQNVPDHLEAEPAIEAEAGPKKRIWPRLAALAALLVAAWIGIEWFGLREALTQEAIRDLVAGAGVWGVLMYLGVFSGGTLVHLPGIAFLVGARIAWGPAMGMAIGYVGAVCAVTVSFLIVRGVGGKALAEIRWKPARRVLAGLERKPIRTLVALRTFFSVSPPLNYALALSPLRFRTYVVGSAIGLVVPVAFVVGLSDIVLRCLS